MKIDIKEDKNNNLVHMTIKVPLRAYKLEENIIITWAKAKELFEENYTCPSTHILGECLDKYLKLNNDYKQLCEQTWSWQITKKQNKTASKARAKSKARPKKKVEK